MLGILFLLGTAREWGDLIVRHHLTISRNLFGTAYYTLVGFHGLHVTIGVVAMLIVGGLIVRRKLSADRLAGGRVGFVVLAFCRCRLDRGVYSGLFAVRLGRVAATKTYF